MTDLEGGARLAAIVLSASAAIAVGVVIYLALSGNLHGHGGQSAEWANRTCADHGGVKQWDGGYAVVCRDGTAHRG